MSQLRSQDLSTKLICPLSAQSAASQMLLSPRLVHTQLSRSSFFRTLRLTWDASEVQKSANFIHNGSNLFSAKKEIIVQNTVCFTVSKIAIARVEYNVFIICLQFEIFFKLTFLRAFALLAASDISPLAKYFKSEMICFWT